MSQLSKVETKTTTDSPRDIISASILPFAIAPNGEVFFLLGKEHEFRSPKKIVGQMWCEFSGGRQEGETPEQTAIREFLEESLNVLGLSAVDLHSQIRSGKYWKRVIYAPMTKAQAAAVSDDQYDGDISRTLHSAMKDGDTTPLPARLRVCYLLQVPWQPDIPVVFSEMRRELLMLKDAPSHKRVSFIQKLQEASVFLHPAIKVGRDKKSGLADSVQVAEEHLEKTELQWWSIDQLRLVLKRGRAIVTPASSSSRRRHPNIKSHFRMSFIALLRLILPFFP